MTIPSGPSESATRPDRLFLLFALLSTPLFLLIAYNTGYGSDQLEYLTVAREYTRGAVLFDYIHGKAFGVYAFLAWLMRMGCEFDHPGIATLITAMYLANITATYFVFSRHLDAWASLATSVLVAISMLFMEQVFFETEGFVYLAGLGAFHFTCRALDANPRRNLFIAGLALAVGFAFKSVVAFYLIGIGIFALIHFGPAALFRTVIGVWGVSLSLGFALGAGLPVLYFAATGRLAPFWEWTIYFPLFHYPAHTIYLTKFLTKLLWFHVLVLGAIALSLQSGVRRNVYGRPQVLLGLCMGGAACIALLKGQGSHYVYPTAGFLLMFATSVFRSCLELGKPVRVSPRALAIGITSVGLLLGFSAVLYKPSAVMRMFSLNDHARDDAMRVFFAERIPPGKKVLFITQTKALLYWLADRQPVMKSVSISVQTTYHLLKHPEMLLETLDDPDLALVEFKTDNLVFEDEFFLDHEENRELIQEFERRLRERFERAHPNPWNLQLWVPKSAPAA